MSRSAQTNRDERIESRSDVVAYGHPILILSFQPHFRVSWIRDDNFVFRLPLDTNSKVPIRDEYVSWFVRQFLVVG